MNPDDTDSEDSALAWAEDSEKWLFEAQEALKADAEAYWSWCSEVERELEERQDG